MSCNMIAVMRREQSTEAHDQDAMVVPSDVTNAPVYITVSKSCCTPTEARCQTGKGANKPANAAEMMQRRIF